MPTAGIAALFRVSVQTIGGWVKDGCPKAGRDKFNVRDVVCWRRQRDIDVARGGGGDLNEERRRLIVEQRRGYELDNRAREAELLPAEEVKTDCLAFAAIVAGQLEALPARVVPRLVALTDPAVMRKVLRDECRAIRVAAGEAFAAYGDRLGDVGDPPSAAGARRRGLGRRLPNTATGVAGAGAVAY